MREISNQTIAIFLVVAIIFSLGGILLNWSIIYNKDSFTGFATSDTGTTQITVSSTLSISLTDSTSNFGSGTISAGGYCTVNSKGTQTGCTGFTTNDRMVLQNDGNDDANITIKSSVSGSSFFDPATGENFSFSMTNKDAGSCASLAQTTWKSFAVADTPYELCGNLTGIDTADEIYIDYQFYIPADAPVGNKQTTITVNAYSA